MKLKSCDSDLLTTTVCLIATEYRNWLLYYSLPCMKGILDKEYHQHYALLVGAITFLSGRSISPEQLEIARKFLMHFVEMYDAYYGEHKCHVHGLFCKLWRQLLIKVTRAIKGGDCIH